MEERLRHLPLLASSPKDPEGDEETLTIVKKPKLYRVVLLNDDYTPMDFVIEILMRFFGKSAAQAEEVMWDVHKKGAGTAGVYTYELAEMKVMQVHQCAQLNHYPLKCTMEEE